jgi:small conductance mechanosensitive channel
MLFGIPLLSIALRIGIAVLVFLFGRWLAGRIRVTLDGNLGKTTIAPSMARLLILAAYYGFMLLVVIFALAIIGVPLEPMLSASLIILVVLGFALKESLSNLAATILFMLFEPFRVGELVEANGLLGTVKEIQLLSTVLVTGDNKEVTIPNSKIQGNNLINYTRLGSLVAIFSCRVSYADDITKVKAVLQEIVDSDSRTLTEPPPLIFVQSLDENCVSVTARLMVKTEHYFPLLRELPERVKLRFDAEGITIPYPQRDVHLNEYGATKSLKG